MKLNRIAQLGAVAAIAALTLTACAANEGTPAPSDDATDAPTLAGELAGAGSSAQDVAVQAWAAGFQTINGEATITYDPSGSGAGRESFQAGAVGFAGSDRAFKTDEIAAGPLQRVRRGHRHHPDAVLHLADRRRSSSSTASTR